MKQLLLLAFFVMLGSTFFAQKLSEPVDRYSHKKIAYITLEDGTEIQGNIKDIDRKKGLIQQIKIKDLEGKKHKLKPEEIKYMYLPPSGLDKLGSTLEFLHDATKWEKTDLDKDIIGKGYAYFEKSKVKIKRKTRVLLLQLLNPSFSSKVKIYYDPFARESIGVGIGGIKVAGGYAKSYYFKKGDAVAYRIKKKNYDDEFKLLFKDCKSLIKKYGKRPKWTDLVEHLLAYKKCD